MLTFLLMLGVSSCSFMALNDLMNGVQRDSYGHFDPDLESRIVSQVLELVKDANGEVKNIAVRW